MSKLRLYLILLMCVLPLGAMAQNMKIEGSIRDSQTKEALAGVNVSVQGESAGTMTDGKGEFSITTKKGSVLEFSFIGYDKQEYVVKTKWSLRQ